MNWAEKGLMVQNSENNNTVMSQSTKIQLMLVKRSLISNYMIEKTKQSFLINYYKRISFDFIIQKVVQLKMQMPVKKVFKPHHTTTHIITLYEDANQPITHKGNLYLSGVSALNDAQNLKSKQIDCVLTIIDQWAYTHFKVEQKIAHLKINTHKWVNLQDEQHVEILPEFEPCLEYIRQNLKNTNVLVHCQMGISRSASIVIAFVMKELGMNLDQAIKHVKSKRNIVQPNNNFMKNLTLFQKQIKEQLEKQK